MKVGAGSEDKRVEEKILETQLIQLGCIRDARQQDK